MSKRDKKKQTNQNIRKNKKIQTNQKENETKRRIKIRRKVVLLSEQIEKEEQIEEEQIEKEQNEKEQSNAPKQIEPEQIKKEQFSESERKETEWDKTEEPDLLEIKIGEEEYETLDLEEELGIDRDISSQPVQNKSSRFPKKASGWASGTKGSTTPSTFNRGTTGTTRRFVPNNAKSASSTSSTRGKSASAASRWRWSTQIHRRWNRRRAILSCCVRSNSEGRKTAVSARL